MVMNYKKLIQSVRNYLSSDYGIKEPRPNENDLGVVAIDETHQTKNAQRLLYYVSLNALIALPFYACAYVYSAYFGNVLLQDVLSFRAFDAPALPELLTRPSVQPLGVHYFGDFLNIWSYTKYLGTGGYFGFSQIFMQVLSLFSYWVAFVMMLFLAFWLVYLCGQKLFPTLNRIWALGIGVVVLVLNQPIMSAIDRGQIHLVMTLLLCFAFASHISSGENNQGMLRNAVLVGMAGSMKLFPGVFVFYFAIRRQWRLFWISLASYFSFLIIGAFFTSRGLSIFRLQSDNLYMSEKYFLDVIPYNHSLKAFGFAIKHQFHGFVGDVGNFMFSHVSLINLLLLVISLTIMYFLQSSPFHILCLLAVLSTLILPITSSYAMSAFLVPICVWIVGGGTSKTIDKCLLALCILQLVPKQISLDFSPMVDGRTTFNNLITPIVSLLILVIVLTAAFNRNRQSPPEHNVSVSRSENTRRFLTDFRQGPAQILIAVVLIFASILAPKFLSIPGSSVSHLDSSQTGTYDSLKSIAAKDFGNLGDPRKPFDRIKISLDFVIKDRPKKNSVNLFSSSNIEKRGMRLDLDIYGNLFLTTEVRDAESQRPYVSLIAQELSFVKLHQFDFMSDSISGRYSISVNNQPQKFKDLATGVDLDPALVLTDLSFIRVGGGKVPFSGKIENLDFTAVQGSRSLDMFGPRFLVIIAAFLVASKGIRLFDRKNRLAGDLHEQSSV
jgi:hypothetical protein